MQLSLPVLHVAQTASACLGIHHPLVQVLSQITVRLEQSAVVLAVMVASGIGLTAGVSEALALVVGAAVLQTALTCSLALLTSDARAHARDLIIEGRGDVQLITVQRERQRFLDPAYRRRLAQSLDALRREADRRIRRTASGRSLFSPRVLADVGAELGRTSRLLRGEAVGLPGVAMADRLLGAHDSPLYGRDADRLREELHQIDVALRSLDEPLS
jgi:hypothetical protein